MPTQNNQPVLWQHDGTTAIWDGLRRDHDLWIPDGDCAVYLYAQGQSRRGPSFQIPFQALLDAQCEPLLDQSSVDPDVSYSPSFHSRNSSEGTSSSSGSDSEGSEVHRIYLGVPQYLSKQDALTWRITTRNFFAWLLGKPLAGSCLSQALADLLTRMSEYRYSTADSVADLLDYADSFGYSDIANKPELALAMLSFADEHKLTDVWIDAFAHCVGMSEHLSDCREYQILRTVNKALIKKSALQMELQFEKDAKIIDSFLSDELSQTKMMTVPGAQRHLDQFRSFLRSHFAAMYGSWPTAKESAPTTMYQELLVEFDCLYSFLADLTCARDDSNTTTNLDIQRIIDNFDHERTLEPLPFTKPLLPDIRGGVGFRTQAHWALQNGRLGSKDKPSAVELVRQAYTTATNRQDRSVLSSPLVESYEVFESRLSTSFDDQLSFADARKVRWVLIYAMLQTLVCATRIPLEVRDTESASYPLHCSVAGLPTWAAREEAAPALPSPGVASLSSIRDALQEEEDEEEADGAEQPPTHDSTIPNTTPAVAPLLPSKSIRRSVPLPKTINPQSADDYFSALAPLSDSLPPPKQTTKPRTFAIDPIMIPTRTTSHHGRSRSKTTTSTSSTSSSADNHRPSSVGSDTVPSLSWSRHSPTSSSASDTPDSAGMSRSASSEDGSASDSSSIYSQRSGSHEAMPHPPSLPQKSAARFGDIYGTAESFEKALWGDDGEFVCPGLAAVAA